MKETRFVTENIDQCILCPDVAPVADFRFARSLGLEQQDFGVKKCPKCGLRWLSPRPTIETYRKLYTDEYYFSGPNAVEQYEDLVPHLDQYFDRRLDEVGSVLPTNSNPLLLDVGAATGEWVYLAKKRGYEAIGVEFSRDAIEKAKEKYGLEILAGDIENEKLQPGCFDLIHMNHVFEHLPDPCAVLLRCRHLLKPRGWLVIEVPQQLYNDLDRLKKLLFLAKKPSFNSYSLHHTYFYTPVALSNLLSTHGYEVHKLRTSNPGRTSPLNLKNILLRVYLYMADRLHQGGNIIEVWARRID